MSSLFSVSRYLDSDILRKEQHLEEWVFKHRPVFLEDMVLSPECRSTVRSYLDKGSVPNCTLHGIQGTGKTSLGVVMMNELNVQSRLFVNASMDNGIDVVRTKIAPFCESVGIGGGIKVVLLDEADRLSTDAQEGLRNLIQSCLDDTRFILTCNYPFKIIDPLKSRCPPMLISFDLKAVVCKVLSIMSKESIDLDDAGKRNVIEISRSLFPDIRRIVGVLQRCSVSGKFIPTNVSTSTAVQEICTFILENLEDPKKCRERWIKDEETFQKDYLVLSRTFFDMVEDQNLLILMAEHMFRMNIVLDKEIEFYAMVLSMRKAVKDCSR